MHAASMVSEGIRKGVLYVGAVIILLGVLMMIFFGGGMILMDLGFLLVGGAMVAWAIVQGRKVPA